VEIAAIRAQLRSVLTGPVGGNSAQLAIREMAVLDPVLFFEIGVSVLEHLKEGPHRPRAYARLFDCPEFLKELVRVGRYTDAELKELCATWIKIDAFLDVRLARLTPGRHDDPFGLPPEQIARVLQVLNHISAGPRLIMVVNHLKHHQHPLVAENATRLVGRRIRNLGWVKQRLTSTEPRVRAAAVEGLWGSDEPSARALLRQSRKDENSRVAANAVLGLYFLGETKARQWVTDMVQDERPSFRRSAVWTMGQMGENEWMELLHNALNDPEGEVRLAAKQALAVIRKTAQADAQSASPQKASILTVEREPVPEESENLPDFRFRFDGSFTAGEK
jgi:hypothetical protein